MMNIKKPISSSLVFNLFCLFFLIFRGYLTPVGGDNLDPFGHITITWDILNCEDDTYNAQVSIHNNQLFRHIERPGWRLSWRWRQKEVIWSMAGAEATEQGDCSRIKQKNLPHSCMKHPVIIDLLPGAPYTSQTSNCCKGGVLSTINQDPSMYGASFQMNVGNIVIDFENEHEPPSPAPAPSRNETHPRQIQMNEGNIGIDSKNERHSPPPAPPPSGNETHPPQINRTKLDDVIPQHFSLGLPGYSCSEPKWVPPSRFGVDRGRRHTQALSSWNIVCIYSQTMASDAPTCCVSLSAFYSETIIPCPICSCACLEEPGTQCIDPDHPGKIDLPNSEDEVVPAKVRCTQHLCPIRVHWHVKTSYKEYWRVKMTVNNFNYVKNYSQWSLVVQHPNLRSVEQVFSFNYKPLNPNDINDTGMFWGIQYYNEILLQSGDSGNVQTEFLLRKEPGFSFRGGFAFPRKISFNGNLCVMPPPDQYPRVPKSKLASLFPE